MKLPPRVWTALLTDENGKEIDILDAEALYMQRMNNRALRRQFPNPGVYWFVGTNHVNSGVKRCHIELDTKYFGLVKKVVAGFDIRRLDTPEKTIDYYETTPAYRHAPMPENVRAAILELGRRRI